LKYTVEELVKMLNRIANNKYVVRFFRNSERTLKFWTSMLFALLALALFNATIINPKSSVLADDFGWVEKEQAPRRGAIVDRQRRTLAGNEISRDIVAVRKLMDPAMFQTVADFIAPHLGITADEIVQKFNDSQFTVKLAENMTDSEYETFCKFRYKSWTKEIEKYYDEHPQLQKKYETQDDFLADFIKSYKEIAPVKNYRRVYPCGEIVSHIIGYSADTQGDFQSHKGLELDYDKLLRGVGGTIVERRDAFERIIPGNEPVELGVIHGWDLRLSISSDIQAICYRVLKEKVEEYKAKGGCVVVMDSSTGEILSMVSYPTFDPENYKEFIKMGPARPDLLPPSEYRLNPMHNLVIQLVFEPGSVMKPVIAAWALEKGAVTTESLFAVSGAGFKVPGRAKKTIRDTHPPKGLEMWLLRDVIARSSNQGMAQVGIALTRPGIIEGLEKFGFGSQALGLSEERSGEINKSLCEVIKGTPSWAIAREATTAFGQGVSVTPMQMVSAINVFANSGFYVKPRILLDASAIDRETDFFPPSERVTVLSEETNDTMVSYLEDVVIRGTGKDAACKGYRVAGKTGTAEKPDPFNGGYSKSRHYASFAGFGPLPDPKYTIMVMMDEPQTKWGGSSCGPVFKAIFETLMVRDGIPPQAVTESKEEPTE
jgi:cell division protein FtsI/penicillin-binding protein 2